MIRPVLYIIVLFLACSCSSPTDTADQSKGKKANEKKKATDPADKAEVEKILNIYSSGQRIYVPIYASIYEGAESREFPLTAFLSVRNADMNSSIVIRKVDYYDSNGDMVRSFLESPIKLKALQTEGFLIEKMDYSGGSGANFIVEWVSDRKVSEPVVESVMSNPHLHLSFVSQGRVMEDLGRDVPSD